MDEKIYKVLNKIENHGFEAYIVGGYVRDYLLNNPSNDVDICTNALPKDIIKIFNIKKSVNNYGSIRLLDEKYTMDITTYRIESDYINRRPQNIEYTSNLLLDIKRRDFTINTLCMNKEEKIFDYLNGKEDIDNKIIRVVGDTSKRLEEDPLRILRAIRFSIVLDFKLDDKIIDFINNNHGLIKLISYTRKQQELNNIFASKNAAKGLKLLKKLNLLDSLEINYDRINVIPNLLGIWSQIDFSSNYSFSKHNKLVIDKIRYFINKKSIDNYDLFINDLYVLTVSAEILGISKEIIIQKKNDLIIQDAKDLKIRQLDILNLIHDKNRIKIVYKDVIVNVLNGLLINDEAAIKQYIIKNWE